MTKTPYWQKLLDPHWQRKRLEIIKRADFKCENCRTDLAMLTVHHSYYQKGVEPWEYPDLSLHCFCMGCHEERADAERELLNNIGIWRASEISHVAEALRIDDSMSADPNQIGDWIVSISQRNFDELISSDYDKAHAV